MADEVVSAEDKDLGAGFDEGAGTGAPAETETTPEKETPTEEKAASEKKGEAPEEEPPQAEEKKEEPPATQEAEASLKKQLDDTKRWGTSQAEENARLKRELEELKGKKEEPKEEEVPEEIKNLYEDYPELAKALDFEWARREKRLRSELAPADVAETRIMAAQAMFQQAVCFGLDDKDGNWVDGHPDAFKVIRSKEFGAYCEQQKIDTKAVNDPILAIQIISKYKESLVSGAAKEHDARLKDEAEQRKAAAGATIHSGKGGGKSGGTKGKDKDDFDGGFDEGMSRA